MIKKHIQLEIALDEGKKVRRPSWEKGSFWVLSKDGYRRILYSDGTSAKVHLNQLNANDWEIVPEEYCLEEKYKIKKAICHIKEDLKRAKGHDGRIEFKYAIKIINKRFGGELV